MIDGTPGSENGRLRLEDTASGHPAAAAWDVRSALALVCLAFVLTLLAGLLLAAIEALGWPPFAHALAVGAVLAGVYASMVGVAWVVSARSGASFAETVRAVEPSASGWYGVAAGVALGGWAFAVAFTSVLTTLGVEVPRNDLALFRLMPGGLLGVAIMVVLLVVVAPIAEEVVYRGVLLVALENRWGTAVALVVSTLLFAAAHMSLVGLLPLLVVGGIFGWLFLASRSLRVAIVAHALFNAFGVAVLLGQRSSGIL